MNIIKQSNFSSHIGRSQQGVALAMMLWFIAALTLLVAGMVSIAKTDVKQVQLHLQQAQAAAAGDGASFLAMQDLLLLQEAGEFKGRGIFRKDYVLGAQKVRVKIIPSTGLVNLNRASQELLAAVFERAAGLNTETAEEIAENIIVWRSASKLEEEEGLVARYEQEGKAGPRNGPFEVAEDVIQVLGVNRDIYERIADILMTSPSGQVGIDPLSAPAEVLAVVAGDVDIANDIITSREEVPFEDNGVSADIPEEYITQGVNGLFRLDADVTMDDGKIYRRRQWVQWGRGGRGGLPWNVLRSEPVKAANMAVEG